MIDETGVTAHAHARLLVNAGGPWVDTIIAETLGRKDARHVRLVKGSHIVVRKPFDQGRCYFFQNADGRIFFAIPYETDFTPSSAPPTRISRAIRRMPRSARGRSITLRGSERVFGKVQEPSDLGRRFGGTLTQAEVDYLMDREWARTADDLLWRRTKQGLKFTANETAELSRYMAERLATAPATTAPRPVRAAAGGVGGSAQGSGRSADL